MKATSLGLIIIIALIIGMVYRFSERMECSKSMKVQSSGFDTTKLVKTSEMMDESRYWKIIEMSLVKINGNNRQYELLKEEISKLTPMEIVAFQLRTRRFLWDTYTSEMWCAGYIMNGGCSDSGFEYFRYWIISRGKATYYKAKENPDNLISEVIESGEVYEYEPLWYWPAYVFKEKTGKELGSYIDYESINKKEGDYPKMKFNWKEDNPESMRKICPKLFAKFLS